MIEIVEITDIERKAEICDAVLHALPDWFGIEECTREYIQTVRSLPFFTVVDAGKTVGFIAVQAHTEYAAEVYVTGILEAYHRQGLGRQLVERCETWCRERNFRFLTVKTLDASAQSEHYDRTRAFYLAIGFLPLEVFPTLWDPRNPVLFLAKPL